MLNPLKYYGTLVVSIPHFIVNKVKFIAYGGSNNWRYEKFIYLFIYLLSP
jgi:hypothetical protein